MKIVYKDLLFLFLIFLFGFVVYFFSFVGFDNVSEFDENNISCPEGLCIVTNQIINVSSGGNTKIFLTIANIWENKSLACPKGYIGSCPLGLRVVERNYLDVGFEVLLYSNGFNVSYGQEVSQMFQIKVSDSTPPGEYYLILTLFDDSENVVEKVMVLNIY